jgi:hypothetical protein
MIWDPHLNSESDQSVIVSYIMDEIGAVCGKGVFVSRDNLEQVARAVETFLEQDVKASAVDSKYLVMLASRALSSVGETLVARKLLVFGTGLVKPSEWEVTDGESMWVLDLKKMTVKTDVLLEMVFFNSLQIILDSIADIWDESDGHGVLGLRHVCSVASALLGTSGKKSEVRALSREIRRLCDSKLEQIGGERGWSEFPLVMSLDFQA